MHPIKLFVHAKYRQPAPNLTAVEGALKGEQTELFVASCRRHVEISPSPSHRLPAVSNFVLDGFLFHEILCHELSFELIHNPMLPL